MVVVVVFMDPKDWHRRAVWFLVGSRMAPSRVQVGMVYRDRGLENARVGEYRQVGAIEHSEGGSE